LNLLFDALFYFNSYFLWVHHWNYWAHLNGYKETAYGRQPMILLLHLYFILAECPCFATEKMAVNMFHMYLRAVPDTSPCSIQSMHTQVNDLWFVHIFHKYISNIDRKIVIYLYDTWQSAARAMIVSGDWPRCKKNWRSDMQRPLRQIRMGKRGDWTIAIGLLVATNLHEGVCWDSK
jgi:hypothetical protein